MSRSYREPWLRYESRWGGLKRMAARITRRAYKVDIATARAMCEMLRTCWDWTREDAEAFYCAEASVDDRERRRSAYKRIFNDCVGVRGWMSYMFRRYRDGTSNKWHVIGSRK